MTAADVGRVLDVQVPGSVRALVDVFPQDRYPFPRDTVADRWRQEIETRGIDCWTVRVDGAVVGFVAVRGDELLHFGIAVEHWGTGVADRALDAVLDRMRAEGEQDAQLWVFTGNTRARRFYERLGWQPTGQRTSSTFAPYPELLRYVRPLT
ncbi:GNAT family N-acetyltransferase [Cellulomonas sp. P5_C5]